jgi:IMP dehydrogenase
MAKHEFFAAMEQIGLALSYNDVRLRTKYSEISPADVCLKTNFSRRITLHIPITSAPMDTVTESKMAIALAKAGGIGIIHRSLTPENQAEEAARVKYHLNGLIAKPICVKGENTIREIEDLRIKNGYGFHTFPVIDKAGKMIGLLTNSDFVFCDDANLTAKDVMSKDVHTAKEGTDLESAFENMRARKKKVLPLIDKENRVKGMYVFSDVKRIKNGSSSGYNTDQSGQLRVGAAIGTGEDELVRAESLIQHGKVDVIVIDGAHGDTRSVIESTLKPLKNRFPDIDIVVGNISEGPSAKRLVDAGADGIKVGQGPGSICTTRIVAGIGCPQVTAVYNCARAIEGSGIPVCADGGIIYSGDITVAIGAGAHCVMLGRILAGTDETPGQIVNRHGVPHKIYRGMGSLGAMQDNQASRQRYGQQGTGKDQIVPEGIEGAVPYQGAVEKVLHQNLEGLRRGMGYIGAREIKDLQERAEFYRISSAGLAESHPHDVEHIQDSPNYKIKGK